MWTVDNPHKFTQNQHKINPKSMEKKLENPTQNQDKLTGKPNSKSIKTHRKTQPKNSPNPPKNLPQTILNRKITWKAQRSRICCSICCHCCSPDLLSSGHPLLLPLDLPKSIVVCECMGLGYERGRELREDGETWNWYLRERRFRL